MPAKDVTVSTSRPRQDAREIVVLGGGVIGLSCALALLEAGRGVTVLEAGTVGCGSSHGNCGTLTPSHAKPLAAPGVVLQALRWMLTPDAPLYVPPRLDPRLWRWLFGFAANARSAAMRRATVARAALLNDSRARLARWIDAHGMDCGFVESGLDYVYRDPAAFDRDIRACAPLAGLGIAVEPIDGATYAGQQPAMREGVAGAIRFEGDACLRPERLVDGLARAVRASGGRIIEGCRVDALAGERDAARLWTPQGEIAAAGVVVALGAWTPLLARSAGLRVPVQPGKGYSITYSRPAVVPTRPLVLRERAVCVTAWDDGFRLGSTMEFSGYDASLNPRRLAALERAAREYLREPVGAEVRERWQGWRPMSRDDVPIIGRVPGHRRLWLATGHGMLGVSMSAASGQLIADLVAGRDPAVDPAPYDPARFA